MRRGGPGKRLRIPLRSFSCGRDRRGRARSFARYQPSGPPLSSEFQRETHARDPSYTRDDRTGARALMAATTEAFDAVVLGAGAAGMMCAISAGRRGRRVLLLEHGAQAGAKILISGGGRCNFTNLEVTAERFLSANPHFCKSALSRYTQHDFIALVERHRIRYHEKTLGQLFCDGSAREILAMLLDECAAAAVDLRTGYQVSAVTRA